MFDIGGVILRVNLRRALEPLRLAQAQATTGPRVAMDPAKLWADLVADPLWRDWQEGRIVALDWHRYITRRLGISLTFDEFCATWNRALDPQTILDDKLFAHLSARCRLALLSNTDPLHAAYMESHFTFGRYFPTRIYSCRVGASKPSPQIYRAALAAMELAAGETVYIDDVAEFVEAARALGLDAIQFRDAVDLRIQLAKRGLLAA